MERILAFNIKSKLDGSCFGPREPLRILFLHEEKGSICARICEQV